MRLEEVPLRQRSIFAMGGGGFTMEPSNPLLDDYVLSLASAREGTWQSGKPRIPDEPRISGEPRILFLPTASGDTAGQITAFYGRFADRPCLAEHLSLFRLDGARRPLREIVLSQDIVYVGGGSMRNLLAIWRAHHLDRLLIEAWRRGIVLAGISAGAMCWFQGGITRSSGAPAPLGGLGLLAGSLTVHADGEPERLPAWLTALRDGALPGGWAVDDGVGLTFRGERLERVVSSRPGAQAQRVDFLAGELIRRRLTPDLLGARSKEQGLPHTDDEAVRELRRVRHLRHTISGRRAGRPGRL